MKASVNRLVAAANPRVQQKRCFENGHRSDWKNDTCVKWSTRRSGRQGHGHFHHARV